MLSATTRVALISYTIIAIIVLSPVTYSNYLFVYPIGPNPASHFLYHLFFWGLLVGMTRLALILTAVVACSSVCSVVAQGGSGGRLQRSTCPSGEIKVQRKDVSREFKEKYMQYNRRAYENKGVHNLPMPESNGCSTMGIKVGGEEDFTSCCDLHDVCYQTCGLTQQKCTYTTPLIL